MPTPSGAGKAKLVAWFEAFKAVVDALGGMGQYVKPGSKGAILANVQRNNPGTFTTQVFLQPIILRCNEAGAGAGWCWSGVPDENWQRGGR